MNWIIKILNYFSNKIKKKKDRIKRKLIRKAKKKAKKKEENVITSIPRYIPGNNINIIDISDDTNVLDVDLIDKNTSDENKKNIRTFTKKWVDIILTTSLIDIQLVFVLAYLGREQIAETLGVAIVTEVIGVTLGYFLKSYCESYSEHKNELEMERIKHKYMVKSCFPTSDESDEEINNDNAVG